MSIPGTARVLVGALAAVAAFGAIACERIPGSPGTLEDGVYCLTADLDVSGTTAFVLRDDTTLDCQGHRIRDLTSSTENAVQAAGDNIVVRNCVVDGFNTQLSFIRPTNYRIEGNVSIGARTQSIYVFDGSHGLVAGNTITAPVQGGDWYGALIYGLADVIGNTVILPKDPGVGALEFRIGFHSYANDGGVVAHNVVKKIAANPGTGTLNSGEAGVGMAVGGSALVYRNVLVTTPQSGMYGIACSMLTGSHLQNLVVGWPYAYESCATHHGTGLKAAPR
jgi:hypothetical protein